MARSIGFEGSVQKETRTVVSDPGPSSQLPDRGRGDPVRAPAAAVLDDPVRLLELGDRRVHPERARGEGLEAEPGAGADPRGVDPRQVEVGEEVVGEGGAAARSHEPSKPPLAGTSISISALTGPIAARF